MGLIHPADRCLLESINNHLTDFQKELLARGRTSKHVRLTLSRIKAVMEKLGARRLADLQPGPLRDAILALPVSVETRNHHLTACKAFTRWLWRQGKLASDPLIGLGRWNAEPDRRVVWRALTTEELKRLITTTEQSPPNLSGAKWTGSGSPLCTGSLLRASSFGTC
ncbi:MAG: hypothetical protein NZ602_09860 [Thermoguttaceae bacterium]|nr:hypothetical protein [Thermoguttaceae bacterium]MDW8037044.1 hypothetical protein [Thermoguttaceae bacterium]